MLPLLLSLALHVCAAAEPDVPGAADHPLLRRYEGSALIGYRQQVFDDLTLPLGPPSRSGSAWTLPTQQVVEGGRTSLLYVSPAERSPLEVFRNYATALSNAGFQTLYTCDEAACGAAGALVNRFLYTKADELDNRGQASSMAFASPSEQHYLAAKLSRPEGDVYISVYAARENFANWRDLTWNRALVLVDIVETRPMEAGKVVVDAAAMANSLASTGRVALYGIYFDTNSSNLNESSNPTLEQISRLLKDNPTMKLYVVGHTDDVGGLAANQDLSRRRAEAVIAALVSQHRADPSRLAPAGVGPLAPVAPNSSEQGRALNRRVELVPQ